MIVHYQNVSNDDLVTDTKIIIKIIKFRNCLFNLNNNKQLR